MSNFLDGLVLSILYLNTPNIDDDNTDDVIMKATIYTFVRQATSAIMAESEVPVVATWAASV